MINIDQITFGYGKKPLFEAFSLEIGGKITGLIGQNGAGKTTLVNLMIGLLRAKEGSITIDGLDVHKKREEVLKRVGVMFEDSDFPQWATLRDHLRFIGQLRGLDPSDAEDDGLATLELFGIADKADEKFQKLSAGMKQKFGIAQAIIGYPNYVILDEPTANLDVNARTTALEYIQDLAYTKDMNFVILSHILHDLERVCDEVVVIHEGSLLMQSSMSEILEEGWVKDYRIRFKDPVKHREMKDILQKENYCVRERGLALEIHTEEREDLDKLRSLVQYEMTPARSILEQLFVDLVGGEIN